MITFPLWFKFLLGLSILTIITGTIRFFLKEKFIDSIKKLPDEKREKLINGYSNALKIQKIFILAIPVNLILIPCLIYFYSPKNFFHIIVLMSIFYVTIIEDFFYRKLILKSLKT